MHHHARAVILLGGWLLVIPPSNGGGKVDLDAPIHTWVQYAAYDTPEECLQALFNARNNADETKNAAISAETKNHAMFGRCVPPDAIYPPNAPAQK